jgi:two-component system sensor histidine kinase YesM
MQLKISIRVKIIIATVMLVFLSLFISGSFFFFNYYKLLVNNTYDALNVSIAQLQESVDTNIKKLDNLVATIVKNKQIDAWLNNDLNYSDKGNIDYVKINELMKELASALIFDNSWMEGHVQAIHIFIDDQDVPIFSRNLIQKNDETTKFLRIKDLSDKSKNTTLFLPPENKNSNVFFIKKVMNYYDTRQIYIICEINQSFFSKELQRYSNQFLAYITNQEGKIYFSNNQDKLGSQVQFNVNSLQKINNISDMLQLFYENRSELSVSRPLIRKEFTVFFSIQREDVFQQIAISMRDFLVISLIILIVFVSLTGIILSTFTRVIPDVVNRLNEISNQNYKAKMPRYKDAQLDLISQTFNRMSSEIETLINKVYRNELMLKENEFKLLQSQMNPHFLTNTMTTISTGAYMRGEKLTYESISALNKFISGRLQSMSDPHFVTVEAELKTIELYLYLQSLRFGDRLNYSIHVTEDVLLKVKIPRLTIEPIVENAVIHGIEDNIKTGQISIVLSRKGKTLIVVVKDNGNGFDSSQLNNEPYTSDESSLGHERQHIGIYNTNKRLQLIYGTDYGLHVHSEVGQGTQVTIYIPMIDLES